MCLRFFVSQIIAGARMPRFRKTHHLAVVLLAVCVPDTWAVPILRVATDAQCAVTLDRSPLPAPPADESAAAALGAALLGSAADALLDAGISFLKTTLDPSQGQYVDQVMVPHDGMFLETDHNPYLGCVMVAVFDQEKPARATLPIKAQTGGRVLYEDANIGKMPNASGASVADRLKYLFPGSAGDPVFYLELVRRYSPDGSAHYFQPVYAFADRMISPHFLSKDPTWELDMSWTPVAGTPVNMGVYKFTGTPPFERSAGELNLQGQGWLSLMSRPEAEGDTVISHPFTIVVKLAEFRSATLFAEALQKTLVENEASLKAALRDAYPWRRKEVKEAANEKAQLAAREKLETYLDMLERFSTDCLATLTASQQTRCAINYIKLGSTYDAALKASKNVAILPPNFAIPEPPPFSQ